jgi:sulfofructose kinase
MRRSSRSEAAGGGGVVGLGLCVVDHLYLVERLDSPDERTRYAERRVSTGGMVATALAQAAQLGCRAELLSAVGDDEAGREARRSLRTAGVQTRRMLLCPSLATTVAVVLVERRSGRRRFLVPDRRGLERRAPDFDLTPIRRGRVLLVDGHFPGQASRAVRVASERGVPVVGDFNRPTPEVLQLLRHVDFPVVPEEFARHLTPDRVSDTLLRLRDEYGGQPVVTQGARGGLYLDGGRLRRFRSPRVRVRDTTGAGDAFHGAFAAGLAEGLSLSENLARAARCGARCCTVLGGVSALLSLQSSTR